MLKKNIAQLNDLYTDAEFEDKALFAEMKSNILLVAGEHYNKKKNKAFNHIREGKNISDRLKLRLTKNHIKRIMDTYQNNITEHSPSVKALPHNEKEQSDRKNAELNGHIINHIKDKHPDIIDKFAKDFCELGEVGSKVFWDWEKGQIVAFEAQQDDAGEIKADEEGQMIAGRPIYAGDVTIEKLYGFNVLRDPGAETWDESPYIIVRKLTYKEDMLRLFPGKNDEDEEKRDFIKGASKETFRVFDASQAGFREANADQVLVREYYFRPSPQHPNGFFYITVSTGILFEDELPFGRFPITMKNFDEMQTSPRGRSRIKQLRPGQSEINRIFSTIATHQITLGEDKIIYNEGSKISKGEELPGIRGIKIRGGTPTILQGRTGSQYVDHLTNEISDLYEVANVAEDTATKDNKLDANAQLYTRLKNRKKFIKYTNKFESFLVDTFTLALETYRDFVEPDALIPVIGKHEFVNIPEFKNSTPLSFQIKIVAMSDDVDSTMGKHLELTGILQYIGNQISNQERAVVLRNMPFLSKEGVFDGLDITTDYDNVVNDILALDRGEPRPAKPFDNHEYYIQRLTNRMKQSDFPTLGPEVHQAYEAKMEEHQTLLVENQKKIHEAQKGFIPSGGGLTRADIRVPNPDNPGETERATFPVESLFWLRDRLNEQGSSQEALKKQASEVQAQLAEKLTEELNNNVEPSVPTLPPAGGEVIPIT